MDSHENLSKRVKVCIIDTGFDERHPTLIGAKSMRRLVATKSFKGDPRNLNDEVGHGTHIAELVQTLAPEAELCIAKVAVANEMPQEDTKLIIDVSLNAPFVKDLFVFEANYLLHGRRYIGQWRKTLTLFRCRSAWMY